MPGPSRRTSSRTAVLLVAGVAGVVLAHAVDYALAFPGAADRARHLAATGHGWLPAAAFAAVGSAAMAVAMAGARGAGGAVFRRAARPCPWSAWAELRRLAAWQASLFCSVEVLERAAVHASPATLLHGRVFVTGLAVQLVVSVALLAVLRLVEQGAAALVRSVLGRQRPARRRRPRLLAAASVAPPAPYRWPPRTRGPPAPLPA
jgi:hypothetical protein